MGCCYKEYLRLILIQIKNNNQTLCQIPCGQSRVLCYIFINYYLTEICFKLPTLFVYWLLVLILYVYGKVKHRKEICLSEKVKSSP